MKILRAEHLGMCFGVRDAIELARDHSRLEPFTVLGDLVHNDTVLADLRTRGVQIENQLEAIRTRTLMVSAHGASERVIAEARQRGFRVMEATCPLVRHAHRTVTALAREGFHPVIVGQRNHVEVCGLTGDLEAFDVVLHPEDIFRLQERARFGVISQTTQPVERGRQLAGLLRERFPLAQVRLIDTVCLPTKQRQHAAIELARQTDVMVVIGGAHSNNTRELVTSCGGFCARVHHVQTTADLRPEWFREPDRVGIAAGTSTPDDLIDEVQHWLEVLAIDLRHTAAPYQSEAMVHE